MGIKSLHISRQAGFTLVEIVMVSVIVLFVAAAVWGVYWSVMNTYYVEQKGAVLQSEGERILDLIANGGHFAGKRIYGLNEMAGVSRAPGAEYPRVGTETLTDPVAVFTDADDYRIGYPLDCVSGSTRFAQFYVEFASASSASSALWYEVKNPDQSGYTEDNYKVKITENMLQRKSGTDAAAFGNYDKTWFKAERLSSVSGYCTGVKVSFYLADSNDLVVYNYRLDRKADPPIGSPDQERAFMNGVPYPKYFTTTVYFLSRN